MSKDIDKRRSIIFPAFPVTKLQGLPVMIDARYRAPNSSSYAATRVTGGVCSLLLQSVKASRMRESTLVSIANINLYIYVYRDDM